MSKNKPLTLSLPATSANLGPAFDAAALAFGLFLKIRARSANEFSIQARGRDTEICGRLENHLILTTYREVLQAEAKPVLPLALDLDNQIPIGKGCGSSASARLAGIALAVHFGKLRWSDSRIVGEASRREHHPDNASACWMGGLTVARMSGESEAQIASITPKGKWPLVLAVPEESLSTEEARRVLPTQYSRADVVTNIQNSMLLLAAFTQARPGPAQLRARRSHPPTIPSDAMPLAPGIAEACRKSRNSGSGLERRRPLSPDFSRSESEPKQGQEANRRPLNEQRTSGGIDFDCDYHARRALESIESLEE